MALFLAPLDDPYGYDAYRLLRSKVVPAGLATVVLGCALGSFAVWLPPLRNEDAHAIATELTDFLGMVSGGALKLGFADRNAAVSLVVMIFLVIGFSLLAYARNNRRNYMAAYPRIRNFYTPSQIRQARRLRRRWIAAGIAGLALSAMAGAAVAAGTGALGAAAAGGGDAQAVGGNVAQALGEAAAPGAAAADHRLLAVPVGVMLAGAAPSLWMIAHGVIVGDRVDIFEYNYQALSLTNRYDITANQTGDRQRVMLAEQRISARCRLVNRAVIGVGIFCTVMLYVVPSLHTPFALGPLLVALALWYAVYKIGEEYARRRYEAPDPDVFEVAEKDALPARPPKAGQPTR